MGPVLGAPPPQAVARTRIGARVRPVHWCARLQSLHCFSLGWFYRIRILAWDEHSRQPQLYAGPGSQVLLTPQPEEVSFESAATLYKII
jgi:hypothetical protein